MSIYNMAKKVILPTISAILITSALGNNDAVTSTNNEVGRLDPSKTLEEKVRGGGFDFGLPPSCKYIGNFTGTVKSESDLQKIDGDLYAYRLIVEENLKETEVYIAGNKKKLERIKEVIVKGDNIIIDYCGLKEGKYLVNGQIRIDRELSEDTYPPEQMKLLGGERFNRILIFF